MIIQVTRDQRTGGAYDAASDLAEHGSHVNESADIEVEVGVTDLYEGTNNTDDPDSADVGDQGKVVDDVPKYDEGGNVIPNEFVFRAGQVISLLGHEIDEARAQAVEEARAEAQPEYSYED